MEVVIHTFDIRDKALCYKKIKKIERVMWRK